MCLSLLSRAIYVFHNAFFKYVYVSSHTCLYACLVFMRALSLCVSDLHASVTHLGEIRDWTFRSQNKVATLFLYLYSWYLSVFMVGSCIEQNFQVYNSYLISKQSYNIISLWMVMISIFIHDWIMYRTHLSYTELISHIQTKLQCHFSMSNHDINLHSRLEHI